MWKLIDKGMKQRTDAHPQTYNVNFYLYFRNCLEQPQNNDINDIVQCF